MDTRGVAASAKRAPRGYAVGVRRAILGVVVVVVVVVVGEAPVSAPA
ncbi:hypothetical protein AB0D71_15485 [Streptomyces avermitilis]